MPAQIVLACSVCGIQDVHAVLSTKLPMLAFSIGRRWPPVLVEGAALALAHAEPPVQTRGGLL